MGVRELLILVLCPKVHLFVVFKECYGIYILTRKLSVCVCVYIKSIDKTLLCMGKVCMCKKHHIQCKRTNGGSECSWEIKVSMPSI